MNKVILLNSDDNVAVSLTELHQGEIIKILDKEILINEEIPMGHKVSISFIPAKTKVFKYGCPIGVAIDDITQGMHVHLHNLKSAYKA